MPQILVVDDNKFMRSMTMNALKGHFSVHAATDGSEAVLANEQHCYDAILMDLDMPGVDGLAATRLIRATEETTGRHVRIVSYSASGSHQEDCLGAGMDRYLEKPIAPNALVRFLQQLIDDARSCVIPQALSAQPA